MHVGHVARLEVLGRLDHQLRWRILREHREVTRHVVLLREPHRVIEALRALEEVDGLLDVPIGLVLLRQVVRGTEVAALVDHLRCSVELAVEAKHTHDREVVVGTLVVLQRLVELAVGLCKLGPPLEQLPN